MKNEIEDNINRIRNLLSHGLTVKEICSTVTDLEQDEIFLAFHAAVILLRDESEFI